MWGHQAESRLAPGCPPQWGRGRAAAGPGAQVAHSTWQSSPHPGEMRGLASGKLVQDSKSEGVGHPALLNPEFMGRPSANAPLPTWPLSPFTLPTRLRPSYLAPLSQGGSQAGFCSRSSAAPGAPGDWPFPADWLLGGIVGTGGGKSWGRRFPSELTSPRSASSLLRACWLLSKTLSLLACVCLALGSLQRTVKRSLGVRILILTA